MNETIVIGGDLNLTEMIDGQGAESLTVGATNVAEGTFTTQSSSGVQTINIPYTGSGYPIAAIVFVEGGAFNSDIPEWYNSKKRYAVGQWAMSKAKADVAPTYTPNGALNQGVVLSFYKNSTSSSTTYAAGTSTLVNTFSSSDATGSAMMCVRLKSATEMSVFVAASSYGLMPSLEYHYFVVYSS